MLGACAEDSSRPISIANSLCQAVSPDQKRTFGRTRCCMTWPARMVRHVAADGQQTNRNGGCLQYPYGETGSLGQRHDNS